MTELRRLADLREGFPNRLERLYRIEVECWVPSPAASASKATASPQGFARYALAGSALRDQPCNGEAGAWERVMLIAESEDRSVEDIVEEIDEIIREVVAETGRPRWRIRTFYWEGTMRVVGPAVTSWKYGYDYVDRKRGSTVREAQVIEIDASEVE